MLALNWEAVGDVIAKQIIESEEFKKFCDDKSCEFENAMRDEVETKFVDPIRERYLKFDSDNESEEEEFEFVMNITHSLLHAFNKYYVTEYLGRPEVSSGVNGNLQSRSNVV